jgi:hypothetical protein
MYLEIGALQERQRSQTEKKFRSTLLNSCYVIAFSTMGTRIVLKTYVRYHLL